MPVPAEVELADRTGPARESVLNQLRAWIVDGTLAPGEIIKDSEIAAVFGVSRTPVREALLQLRADGLVDMKPKGWTQVRPLDRNQIEHLFRVVVHLEELAARLAAERPDRDISEAVAANQHLSDLIDQAGPNPDPETAWEIVEANDHFHLAILAIANNEFLADALEPFKALMRRYERIYFNEATAIRQESVDQHWEMLDAIQNGDADAAAEIAVRNFENSPLYRTTHPAGGNRR